jgi:hypothetical protein
LWWPIIGGRRGHKYVNLFRSNHTNPILTIFYNLVKNGGGHVSEQMQGHLILSW